jgi:hypothetical protein
MWSFMTAICNLQSAICCGRNWDTFGRSFCSKTHIGQNLNYPVVEHLSKEFSKLGKDVLIQKWEIAALSLHPDSVAVMIERSWVISYGSLNIPLKRCVPFQIHIGSKCCIGQRYHWIFSDVYFPFADTRSFFHQKVKLAKTTVYSAVLAFFRFPYFLLLLA